MLGGDRPVQNAREGGISPNFGLNAMLVFPLQGVCTDWGRGTFYDILLYFHVNVNRKSSEKPGLIRLESL